MESQMDILLWKAFKSAARNKARTAGFFVAPIIFKSLVLFVFFMIEASNDPDCDLETVTLPQSHPAHFVSSLVCSDLTRCATTGYEPARKIGDLLAANESYTESRLCPGRSYNETLGLFLFAGLQTCRNRTTNLARDADAKARRIPAIDLVFRGEVLYYPNDTGTGIEQNITKLAQEQLDGIAQLQTLFPLSGLLANTSKLYQLEDGSEYDTKPISESLGLLALLTRRDCFTPLKDRMRGFKNLEDALTHARGMNNSNATVWGIVDFIKTGNAFQYKLLVHSTFRYRPQTLYLQSLIESAIVEWKTGVRPAAQLELKSLPKRCHKNPEIYNSAFMAVMPLVGFAFCMISYTLIIEMVQEKADGLQEFLFIAGVPRWKIKLSWFLFGVGFFLFVSIAVGVFLKFVNSLFIENTSLPVILLFMILYGLSSLCMCFFLASIVPSTTQAMGVYFVSLFLFYSFPNWAQMIPQVGYQDAQLIAARVCGFLHPVTSAVLGWAYIIAMEKTGTGYNFNNLSESPDPEDKFQAMTEILIYLLLQCPFYLALAWYFEQVVPSKYGLKRPFYFVLTLAYWRGEEGTASSNKVNPEDQASVNVEPVSSQKEPGIILLKLTKSFGKGKVAVDNLSVKFYKGEITALLGHNGAGKSTTMNMLTGMIGASSGKAIIGDKNIATDMGEIRKTLGFCPQYDIIYPDMTVKEHMQFYGSLRKIPWVMVQKYYSDLFKQMKMTHALHTVAKSLSGGMKRKLSIAIAFMGDPTTVILDEPTSAIDPFSRRAIWDAVLRFRAKSTVLISTHYMQEADVLGDRIAIIDKGSLKCYGSPLYLKSNFGSGFQLKVAHTTSIDSQQLQNKLQETMPLKFESSGRTATAFSIPMSVARTDSVIPAFKFLEDEGPELGIVSFGIAESTIEQVFFNVAEAGTEEEIHDTGGNSLVASIQYEKARGLRLIAMQFEAIIKKRFHLSRKSVTGFALQVFAPLIFVSILLGISQNLASAGIGGDVMQMHPWNTTTPNRFFYQGPKDGSFITSLLANGLGPACPAKDYDIEVQGYKFLDKYDETSLPVTPDAPFNGKDCDCSVCPDDAVEPKASSLLLKSDDTLMNLNGRNVTDYLLKTPEFGVIGGVVELEEYKTILSDPSNTFLFDLSYEVLLDRISNEEGFLEQLAGTLGGRSSGPQGGPPVDLPFFDDPLPTATTAKAIINIRFIGSQANASRASELFARMSTTTSTTPKPSSGQTVDSSDIGGLDPLTALISTFLSFDGFFQQAQSRIHQIWAGVTREPGQPTKLEIEHLPMKNALLNAYNNVMLRATLSKNTEDHSITMFTQEVSMTNEVSVVQALGGILLGYFSAISLLIPSFNVLLVITKERASGNRQLQLLMGLYKPIYWMANFFWDVLFFLLSVAIMIAFISLFPDTFEIDLQPFSALCVLYGVNLILFNYLLSLLLRNAKYAIMVMWLFAPIFSILSIVLLIYRSEDWYENTDLAMTFMPPYFICRSLIDLEFNKLLPTIIRKDIWEWDVLGKRFATAGLFSATMILLIILVDAAGINLGGMLRSALLHLLGGEAVVESRPLIEDEDVLTEEKRILSKADQDKNALTVERVVKNYGGFLKKPKTAVKGVSFGVSKGESFGLLGVNGAGKTTLFKMLTGFHSPSVGDARIGQYSIFNNARAVGSRMSYCPQEDVLFETLTPKEHLQLYGRIRGIPSVERSELAEAIMSDLGLSPHSSKQSTSLSGGNKRKLNFAIALMDYPEVLFLDEMTTGMDPRARRSAWNSLKRAIGLGCASVITSHSMEECEQLCDRIVIMVNGSFKCIGGVQYLKDKYGKNYSLKFRFQGDDGNVEGLKKVLYEKYTDVKIIEEHLGYLGMEVPAHSIKLSALFTFIHSVKSEFSVVDFSVSQTTLEHVFVNMVKDQE